MSDFATGPVQGEKARNRLRRTPSAKGVEKNITAPHGSYRGYNQGCRCFPCTASKSRYNAEAKEKARVGA